MAISKYRDAAQMEQNIDNATPYIGENGNWFRWNTETETYEDTGKIARGEKGLQGVQGETGLQGLQGIQGLKGDKGEAGYSPIKGMDYWTAEDIIPINEAIFSANTAAQNADTARENIQTDLAEKADKTEVYGKIIADKRFANNLTGIEVGGLVNMPLAHVGSYFNKLSALGETTEVGTGDKSPNNPYVLQSSKPGKITVCGKNLLKPRLKSGTYIRKGVTYRINADYSVDVIGTLAPKEYQLFNISDLKLDNDKNYVLTNSLQTSPYHSVTLTGANRVIVHTVNKTHTIIEPSQTPYFNNIQRAEINPVSNLDTELAVNFHHTPQLEIGTQATEYEPYNGIDYLLPQGLELNGLANGICDEYDTVSGVLTQRVGKVVLNGSEDIIKSTLHSSSPSNYKAYTFHFENIKRYRSDVKAPLISDKYITISANDGWMGKYTNAVAIDDSNPNMASINFYNTIPTLEEFKTYLTQNLITVFYELETPIITQIAEPINPIQNLNVFTDSGNVKVDYNKDTNKVIENLTNSILSLGGNI